METKRIPPNYNPINSKILNIVETIIIDALIIFFITSLKLSRLHSMQVGGVLIPVTVLGIIGLHDQSLCTGLYNFIKFKMRRRVLDKPDAAYIKAKDKAMLKKRKKEMKNR